MTPTPRTDDEAEYWLDPAMSGEHQIVPAEFARQLERELAAKDAHADEIYKAAVDLAAKLEADLATERALADRLAETLANVQVDYASTGAITTQEVGESLAAWKEGRSEQSEIDRELDACAARSARDWRPLPGDADEPGDAKRLQTETDDQAGDTT
jgi:hypothetical protein